MMRLYDSEVSGNCYKVRLLLSHLKIPYERVEIDVLSREKRVEHLGEKNPAAKIPILEIGDGRFVKVRQEGGRAALAVLDRYLGRNSFLVCDRYSIADISMYGYSHCAAEGGFDLGPYPHVRGWISRVSGQEGYCGMSKREMAR